MVGHGRSSAGSYVADPTSPLPSHCASIVVTGTLRVNQYLSQLFLLIILQHCKKVILHCKWAKLYAFLIIKRLPSLIKQFAGFHLNAIWLNRPTLTLLKATTTAAAAAAATTTTTTTTLLLRSNLVVFHHLCS